VKKKGWGKVGRNPRGSKHRRYKHFQEINRNFWTVFQQPSKNGNPRSPPWPFDTAENPRSRLEALSLNILVWILAISVYYGKLKNRDRKIYVLFCIILMLMSLTLSFICMAVYCFMSQLSWQHDNPNCVLTILYEQKSERFTHWFEVILKTCNFSEMQPVLYGWDCVVGISSFIRKRRTVYTSITIKELEERIIAKYSPCTYRFSAR